MSTDLLDLGPHPDFPEYRIVYSQARAFGEVSPTPAVEVLAEFYQGEYGRRWGRTVDCDYLAKMRSRAAVQREFIRRHAGLEHVHAFMDIGCGAGLLLEAIAPLAECIRGWETDAAMVAWGREHLEPRIELFDRHFDASIPPDRLHGLVAMSHVLEHIPDPARFLRELGRWMSPRGLLFVEVPNDSLACVQLQVRHKVVGLAHVNFFTPVSLAACAADAGFVPVKLATYGPPAVETWRQRTGESKHPAVAKPVDKSFPLDTEAPEDGAVIRALVRWES